MAMEALANAEAEGVDLVELLSNGYSAGMKELGDLFGMGEIFLPELIFATEVMKAVSAEIEGKMDMSEVKHNGTLVIGTVEGDVHDIGKGIVASLVKTNGVEVFDPGKRSSSSELRRRSYRTQRRIRRKLRSADYYDDCTERHRRSTEGSRHQR